MNTLDERLRSAIRATAEEITPESVPPLRLRSARRDERPAAERAGRKRRWRWLAPACAAAAVIAIVTGSVVISGGPAGRPGVTGAIGAGSVPRYYVGLELTGGGKCCLGAGLPSSPVTVAVVRATATGTALARITPPRPYGTFTHVTAAADDRTFVLTAKKVNLIPVRTDPRFDVTGFFLLHIDPASGMPNGRARLAPLPITLRPASAEAADIALSPDATKLAVHVEPRSSIHVFTLATGADRVWNGTGLHVGLYPGDEGSLSWTRGGRSLAFIWTGVPNRTQRPGVWMLNTAAPGTSLLASSRLAAPTPAAIPRFDVEGYWRQAIVTGDGQTIVAVVAVPAPGRTGRFSQELVEFSARTGRVLRTLSHIPFYATNANRERVLWASHSGDVLIVSGSRPGASVGTFNAGPSAGIFSRGHVTPIRWSNRTFTAAW